MRIMVLVLLCLAACTTTLHAEEKPHYCKNYPSWNVISENVLKELGLSEKVRKIEQAIASVRVKDIFRRDITVSITDCPIYGHRIRSNVQVSFASFMQAFGYAGFPKDYDVFIEIGELRSMSDDELARVGREQGCLIHAGMANDLFRLHDMQTRTVIECRHDTALALGEMAEEKWYARLLAGATFLPKAPELPESQTYLENAFRASLEPRDLRGYFSGTLSV